MKSFRAGCRANVGFECNGISFGHNRGCVRHSVPVRLVSELSSVLAFRGEHHPRNLLGISPAALGRAGLFILEVECSCAQFYVPGSRPVDVVPACGSARRVDSAPQVRRGVRLPGSARDAPLSKFAILYAKSYRSIPLDTQRVSHTPCASTCAQ
ncbi:protein of unknown function [Burkholderia multivorans]